ncbi:carboxymuconolactone decarboxylase family protein [Spiractinospora alimapuensis]|nr:carboxymuconolactone decarboxylase family protein [Spiractinospora alimapuensis]
MSAAAYKGIFATEKYLDESALPHTVLELVKIRASQINGCGYCVDMHSRDAKKAGETDERLFTVAAWRETEYFTDAERAALTLTEAVTRMADTPDPVPDDVWNEAARHFDEESLSALVLTIAQINLLNRIAVPLHKTAGGDA